MNTTCQEEVDLVFHPAFQLLVLSCVISSFLAYIFMAIFFKKYAFKVHWHHNIKILFFFNMFISFILATTVIVNFFGLWYRMISKSQNCELVVTLEHCVIIRWIFLIAFCLITTNHAAIVIERLWATVRLVKYEKSSVILGVVLVCTIILFSCIVVYLVMIPEDYTEYAPSCLSFSATHIGNNIYILFTSQFFMELIILTAQKCLLKFNRRRIKRLNKTKKTQHYLTMKYQAIENLDVLEQMNPLIVTCSLVIGGYNVVAIVIRFFRGYFTRNHYIILVFAIFIIPYLPFLLTFTAYHMLKKQIKKREESFIRSMQIETVNTPNFSNDCYNWDQFYIERYAPEEINVVRRVRMTWWTKLFRNRVSSSE